MTARHSLFYLHTHLWYCIGYVYLAGFEYRDTIIKARMESYPIDLKEFFYHVRQLHDWLGWIILLRRILPNPELDRKGLEQHDALIKARFSRRNFMRLPIEVRRRIMERQIDLDPEFVDAVEDDFWELLS